ncbi:MAG: GNAT family N-acetyltransferase [Pseudomonadota bacterium]
MAPQEARPGIHLRQATSDDLGFIYATERLPGYELLTGQWSHEEHVACLAHADTRYLVASPSGGELQGFVILQPLADRHEGTKIKRIAVTTPGAGFGQPLLLAVFDWVFTHTSSYRLWLDVFTHNGRAQHVYRSVGMREDGLLRQAYQMPDGSRSDRLIMSILRSEWRAR